MKSRGGITFCLFVFFAVSIVGKRVCSKGYVYWAPHRQCYLLESRGPCEKGNILIEKPEGPMCIEDFRERLRRIKPMKERRIRKNSLVSFGNLLTTHRNDTRTPFLLKHVTLKDERESSLINYDRMSSKEIECYEKFQVYWPPKDRCYSLLASEPCDDPNEWLVLEENERSFEVRAVCKEMPCPCEDADLCEVDASNGTLPKSCGCIVSRAATQNGICGKNEQLLIDPFGRGQCGCKRDPYYVRYQGECYLLFEQGPCPEGQILQYSPFLRKTECSYELCPDGSILYTDGYCYYLETKGPCNDGEYLDIHPRTKDLSCFGYKKKRARYNEAHRAVKRVFDIIPNQNGGLVGKSGNCIMDSRGACRDTFNFEDPRIGKRLQDQIVFPLTNQEHELALEPPENISSAKEYALWLISLQRFRSL